MIARLRLLLAAGMAGGLVLLLATVLDGHRDDPRWWEPPPGGELAMPGTWPGSTTTTEPPPDDGTADIEAILEGLYLGWFRAITEQDRSTLDEVVATAPFREAGVRAMESMRLLADPEPGSISFTEVELLHTTEDCMAVWSVLDLSTLLGPEAGVSGVDVLWLDDGRWRFASSWRYRDDLWIDDCTRFP